MLKTQNKKLQGFLLLLLGIGISVLAQVVLLGSRHGDLSTYFSIRLWMSNTWDNTSPIPGVCLYILAGVLFIFGISNFVDTTPALQIHPGSTPRPSAPKLGFWATSLALSIVVGLYARESAGNNQYGYIFSAIWVFAILLLIASTMIKSGWHPPSWVTILGWLKKHRVELFVLTIIVVLAFLIRFIDVELHPYSFINDEGHMGTGGDCIIQSKCQNFFSLGWAAQSRLAYFPYAISIALLGRTALAVRLISVITGTLSVLAVYLLARELFNPKIAWLAAITLSVLPVHIHFSRTGVDNIIDSLTAPLILWLLFRGIRRGSILHFVIAGIITGLCLYTYPGSLLAATIGIGTLGYIALRTRGFLQAHRTNIAIFILAGLIIIIPLLGYYASDDEYLLYRWKRESILQNDGITELSKITGLNPLEVLTVQFAKSSLVFIATNAPGNFFSSPRPYLPAAEAIIFMLGIAYVLWRIKDIRYTVVFIWFWAVVILGSTLTGGPPTSQRMLMSTPALAIIVALGMTSILNVFNQLYPRTLKFSPIILLGLMLYFGYANISYYFYDYRIGHYYEDPVNELTYETRTFIAPLHTQGRMYLIANPDQPYLTFESFNYFSPDVEKDEFNEVTKEALANLPKDKDILFLALPNYQSNLKLISQWVPGGKWTEFPRRYQPDYMLFYTYKITKEQLAAFRP